MRVTVLGHASLLFEAGDERILLDPVLRTTSLLGSVVHQYPRALRIDRMPTPTVLVVTHDHYDHCDPETLQGLPKNMTVVIPPSRALADQLSALGFTELQHLDAWEQATYGALRLTATPSEADVTEFGLVVEADDARFWHMSDAEPPVGTSERIVSDLGPVDVASVKYQPPDPLLNFLHNLGSSFEPSSTARWLESACACRPKLAFPYASGLCLLSDYAWMNRYAYPFSPEYVSSLLGERLAGVGKSAVVRPGDVIAIERTRVQIEKQASEFVRQCGEESSIEWEPIEADVLRHCSRLEDKESLKSELTRIVTGGEFAAWLQLHAALLQPFRDWRVRCQFTVHLDDTERMNFQTDFADGNPEVRLGKHPAANYFLHLAGEAGRRLLAGEASSAEVMYQGCVRLFERIVSVRDGQVAAPDIEHLYGEFPDPFLCFLNARARVLGLR